MCSSLDGSQSRAITRISISSDHRHRLAPRAAAAHRTARSSFSARQSVQPSHTLPNVAAALKTHAIEPDRDRLRLPRSPSKNSRCALHSSRPMISSRQRPRAGAPLAIKLAELARRSPAAPCAPLRTERTKTPVRVRLAILLPRRVPQIRPPPPPPTPSVASVSRGSQGSWSALHACGRHHLVCSRALTHISNANFPEIDAQLRKLG